MKRISLLASILLTCLALGAWSQEQTAGTPQKKTIKKVPMTRTAAHSGEEMYMEYCAVCHGKDGKGGGPAATELKVPPTDLTTMAKLNNGKFPSAHVSAVLLFGTETPAHGTKDMPIWGRLLGSTATHGTNEGMVRLRVANLTKYIESLQSK